MENYRKLSFYYHQIPSLSVLLSILFASLPASFWLIAIWRGAVIEWLERLAVVRKVAGLSLAWVKILEKAHCPPSSEWVSD